MPTRWGGHDDDIDIDISGALTEASLAQADQELGMPEGGGPSNAAAPTTTFLRRKLKVTTQHCRSVPTSSRD